MRMDRPVEGGYRSAFTSHCGDRRSFFFWFGRHVGIILFPFPLTTADWIGIVWTIRHGAANICGTSPFKIFSYLQVGVGGGNGAKSHCIFGSYLYWRERGWAWSHISPHKKTWSSIINYCEKIRQKLYTSPRGKQTCMGWYWCCQHS